MRGASSSIMNVAGRSRKRERLHSLKIKEGIPFQGEQLLMDGKVYKCPFEINVLLVLRTISPNKLACGKSTESGRLN